ncbi:protein of unknown function [Chryseobacterium sp. JV274]|nr:protein of unknown function [Chryseobacterium sp. JV274]
MVVITIQMYIAEIEYIMVQMLKLAIRYLYVINLFLVTCLDLNKKYPEKFYFPGYPFYNG